MTDCLTSLPDLCSVEEVRFGNEKERKKKTTHTRRDGVCGTTGRHILGILHSSRCSLKLLSSSLPLYLLLRLSRSNLSRLPLSLRSGLLGCASGLGLTSLGWLRRLGLRLGVPLLFSLSLGGLLRGADRRVLLLRVAGQGLVRGGLGDFLGYAFFLGGDHLVGDCGGACACDE